MPTSRTGSRQRLRACSPAASHWLHSDPIFRALPTTFRICHPWLSCHLRPGKRSCDGRAFFIARSVLKPKRPTAVFSESAEGLTRIFFLLVERVVLLVLGLRRLVKRREALRGRNFPRDSRTSGAPMVHRASEVQVTSGAVLLTPMGHPNDASENPLSNSDRTLSSRARVTSSGYRHFQVVALDSRGGIGVPILRRRSGATRRVDSSLRSLRTQRSQCRRVCSGLNKTLFASIGPNLRYRGHHSRCPAMPGAFPRWKSNAANWAE